MTLRDYFAAKAIARIAIPLVARPDGSLEPDYATASTRCFCWADAMLKTRNG